MRSQPELFSEGLRLFFTGKYDTERDQDYADAAGYSFAEVIIRIGNELTDGKFSEPWRQNTPK